jgi:hypothetical protein
MREVVMPKKLKTPKGNTVVPEVWVTHYDSDYGPYLGSASTKPWGDDYKAPITKYADNTRFVNAEAAEAERDDLRRRAEAAEAEVARLRAELATARAYGWRSAIEASSGRLLSFAEKMKDRDDEPSIHIRAAAAEVRLLSALTPDAAGKGGDA